MTVTMSQTEARLAGSPHLSISDASRSTIYTMIPSVVRSRIPVLNSLRHTARTVVLHGSRVRRGRYAFSCTETTKEKESYSFASTTDSDRATTPSTRPDSPDESTTSQDLSLATLRPQEKVSGVDWDVAFTGIRLWITAKAQADQGGDPVALRSMHIDALRYMHMALPADLTPLEIHLLQASMSPQLSTQAPQAEEGQARRQPSILRQSVAHAVCWVVAGMLLLLPIVMTSLNQLLQLEREHHVTERLITTGLELTSTLGERGIVLHQALVRFKHGRVGGACVDLGSWVLEGIIGGFNDGLDAVARNQRKASGIGGHAR